MSTDRLRVLLVEDNPGDARLIREMLADASASVDLEIVNQLASGLSLLTDPHEVDAVLLDLGLPDSRGHDTFLRVRETAPHVPTIILTGRRDEAQSVRMVHEGAQDYLVKGRIDGEQLLRSLRYAIERGRAEAERTSFEKQLKAIFDSALDAIITMDEEGRILGWNFPAERIFDWPAAEVVGRPLADVIIPERNREAHRRGLAHFVATGEGPILNRRVELSGLHRDGHEFPVELTVTPVRLGSSRIFNAFIRDITDRREAEERLRATQERLRHVLTSTPAVLYATRLTERGYVPSWVSENLLEVTGYGTEEALGPAWWVTHVHAEDLPRVLKEMEILSDNDRLTTEYRFQNKDGSYRWLRDEARVLRGQTGEPLEVFGAWLDVTERHTLERQLLQSQKMEAVGRLAGGIAHDFNNVLTAILGTTELLLGSLADEDPCREDLGEIKKAGDRAASLTRQLLTFSRHQVLAPRVLDLNEVIGNLHRMLERVIGEDIEVRTYLADDLRPVRADPGQVEQVVMNLAVNSRDAMLEGGALTIETANVELDEDHARENVNARPGPHVMLAIHDTGVGMDQTTLAQIFEPFFTTKEQGKGTGLGLATVYGIVKQSGGHIWVHSEPGRGTTFKVFLPQAESSSGETEQAPVNAAGVSGTETILVVEDDVPVREVIRKVLERYGYDVLIAESGDVALRLAREHPKTIHLLLTDVVMPGIGGRDLSERLASLRPGVQVLFLSGYTDDAIIQREVLEEGTHFLQKPFSPTSLARKVREALDRCPPDSPPGS